MKEYKLTSKHADVSIRVSDVMEQAMKACWKEALGAGKECGKCSWRDAEVFGVRLCEVPEIVGFVMAKDIQS